MAITFITVREKSPEAYAVVHTVFPKVKERGWEAEVNPINEKLWKTLALAEKAGRAHANSVGSYYVPAKKSVFTFMDFESLIAVIELPPNSKPTVVEITLNKMSAIKKMLVEAGKSNALALVHDSQLPPHLRPARAIPILVHDN